MFSVNAMFALLLFLFGTTSANPVDNYEATRSALLYDEEVSAIGGSLAFIRGECTANKFIMALKNEEINKGRMNVSEFLPARNFIEVKSKIEKSKVFQFIKKMPKGASLHAHSSAFVSADWIFDNVTYRKNLYICDTDKKFILRFFENPRNNCTCLDENNNCAWESLSERRSKLSNTDELDKKIRQEITLGIEKPENTWPKFAEKYRFLSPLLTYRPVYEAHYYEGLKQLYDDNVMYLELRSTLSKIYELDGTTYDHFQVIEMYHNITERFKRDYPKFVGAKLIYAPVRTMTSSNFDRVISEVNRMKNLFPNFFAGFDLVDHEDMGTPLITYADRLRKLSSNNISMFFHAGETNWYGTSIDENLLDAVLLGSKRIGHAFAITKHPKVLEMIKKQNIAIEICPISNQVLNYVTDLRNHPASFLFANNFPVVISNDDPGFWGAEALSYDFYEAFMGLMSAKADIRALRQLAINSILYSSMNNDERKKAMQIFNEQWLSFINEIISANNASTEVLKESCPENHLLNSAEGDSTASSVA